MTNKETKKGSTWAKFVLEFVSVFIAVVFAFALNNWNDNRKANILEKQILKEISNGLTKDIDDIEVNTNGHKDGIKACHFWRRIINNGDFSQDSILFHYMNVTRDFITVQNKAGYETLKSKGLELIKNDSLRFEIITLYEYDYQSLEKFEETYAELQFHNSYYEKFNEIIAPFFIFDDFGNIRGVELPIEVDKKDKNIFLTYLWKIEMNRLFILYYYSELEKKTAKLIENIEKELKP